MSNMQYTTEMGRWMPFIHQCATRLGNCEDTQDRTQSGWLAVVEGKDLPESALCWKIRGAVTMRQNREIPFSRLASTDEDGEESSPIEEIADDNGDPETILEGMADALVESAVADVESIVDHALKEAIANDNQDRVHLIMSAWKEYQETEGKPTVEPTPRWAYEVPVTNGGKGEYLSLAEDAAEEDELASADIDLSHIHVSDSVLNRRIGAPMGMKVTRLGLHSNEDMEPEKHPDIEMWPSSCWKAVRESFGTPEWFKVMFNVWAEIDPANDTEKAWSLRYLASHLVNRGVIDRKEQFYSPAIHLLGLPHEWLDCEDQEEGFGEEAVDSSEGELAYIAGILYGLDWEGWDVEELEAMTWPSEPGLFESILSHGDKPWETGVFKTAVVKAAMNGADWKLAQKAGWDAWRGARMSKEASHAYVRAEMGGIEPKEAARTANAVNRFTSTTLGKVVGLTTTGLRVNGRPGVVETWDWQKVIANASRISVEAGKEESFLAAVRGIGGQASIFAMAFESASKWRMTHTA